MKQQKKLKGCAALLMGMAMGLMFSMNVMAEEQLQPIESATIDGTVVTARSSVSETFAIGSTVSADYTPSVYATVKGVYIYVNPVSAATDARENSAEGVSSATIAFTAPQYYRSLSLTCTHTVNKGVQDWSCKTRAIYP